MISNERVTCEAVVRLFEDRLGARRTSVRRPEVEKACPSDARIDYLVKVGPVELAIEHTLIEAFAAQVEDNVRFEAFVEPIEKAFTTGLPGKYQLIIEPGSLAGIPKQKIDGIRAALIDWVKRTAPFLGDSPPKHYVRARPEGVPFEVGLYKLRVSWPTCLIAARFEPQKLEEQRAERIGRALADKVPKLRKWEKQGASSVLIFENADIALSNHIVIKQALVQRAGAAENLPDYVVLVETWTPTWAVFMLVVDRQFNTQSQDHLSQFDRNDLCDLAYRGI